MDRLALILGVDASLLKQAEGGKVLGGAGETCRLHAPARCIGLSYDVYQREGRWCAKQWCDGSMYAHLELEPFAGWQLRRDETCYVCDDKYLDPDLAVPAGARTVVLKTPTGSGKTTAITQRLHEDMSCWILSTRVLLVNDLVKRFGHLGFVSYRHVRDWDMPPARLVVTIHSLYKLQGHYPDMLVLDESESLFSEIFANKTLMKWSSRVLSQLRGLCRRCKVVIAADANASPMTLETLRQWRRCLPRPHLVWSSYTAHLELQPRVIITTDLAEWTRNIRRRHAEGSVQYTFSNFLGALQSLRGPKTLLLTRETSSAEKDALSEVDRLIGSGELYHVLASPTVESGVSLESGKFACVNVALVDSTTDPAAALQGMMRVRKARLIHLCLVNVVPPKPALRKDAPAGTDLAALYAAQQARYYNDYAGSLLKLMVENGLNVSVDVRAQSCSDIRGDGTRQAQELLAAADIDGTRAAEIKQLVNTHRDTPGLKLQLKKYRLVRLFTRQRCCTAGTVARFGLHRDFVLDRLDAYVNDRPDAALQKLHSDLQQARPPDLRELLPRARGLLPPTLKDDIFASGAPHDNRTLNKLTDLAFLHLTGIRRNEWAELAGLLIKNR